MTAQMLSRKLNRPVYRITIWKTRFCDSFDIVDGFNVRPMDPNKFARAEHRMRLTASALHGDREELFFLDTKHDA